MRPDLHDAAIMLLGHGTTLNADSAIPVFQHAQELRKRAQFSEVREAFWKQPPYIKDVLSKSKASRVFIVPLFISEGYFSEQVIPRELGFRSATEGNWSRVLIRGNQSLFYCKPIGTHPKMAEVLVARARHVIQSAPFPRAPKPGDVTLFIAGHGTTQNENSRKVIEQQAEIIRELHLFAGVHAVFMEEEPRITSVGDRAETKNIVVVPFFISDGLHTQEDIPVMLGEPARIVQQRVQAGQPTWRNPTEKRGKLIWYAKAVGTEPSLIDVILERVSEMAISAR